MNEAEFQNFMNDLKNKVDNIFYPYADHHILNFLSSYVAFILCDKKDPDRAFEKFVKAVSHYTSIYRKQINSEGET